MVAVRKNEHINFEENDSGERISVERMELDVDTAAELPEVDFLSGYKLYMGSIAWVIETGEFYAMMSDGTWVNQGEGASAATMSVQSAAPMRMMSAVKPETVEPESEVNEIEPLSEAESIEDGASE